MNTGAILRKLRDKGLTLDDAIEIIEMIEAGLSKPDPVVSKAALRTRKWRQKLETVTETITRDVTVTRHGDERKSPEPPKKTTPIPPLKGGTSPVEAQPLAQPLPSEPQKSLAVWVSEIWEITPRPGRERSGKRDLENSLRAAQRRGADLAQIKAGLVGYFASEDATKAAGQFCKGVHVVISSGRWEAFTEATGADPPEPVDPWRQRMIGWEVNRYWNSEWGPKPGKPGCLAPESQAEIAA